MVRLPFSRENFLKGAALTAGAATVGVPAFIPSRGEAADQVKIGVVDPRTGTYAALGQDEIRGMQMATNAWNKRGGALGREVALVIEDDAADPGVGVQKARKLINQDKCVALIGTVSSAVSLSVGGAANALGVLFMDTGGHTDDFTMKDCHWSSFQICHPTWQLTHATGFAFAKKFGLKWYMLSPDYAYGHSIVDGYLDIAKTVGAQVLGNDFAPLGTTEYGTYLTKIQSAKPDVFINSMGGNDFVNSMKQANGYGLLKQIAAGGPLLELENVWALPPDARVGYWGIEWHYTGSMVLGNKKSAHDFVAEYRKAHNQPPTPRSCFGYLGADWLIQAINDAKSTDATKMARALEGRTLDSPLFEGTTSFRKDNHALVWPMWVGTVRANGTPRDHLDNFDVVDRIAPEKISQSDAQIAKVCKLGYPS